ncbi:MAG: hypothetical protein IPL90_06380 [Holophagales bacterium]|nr:hypothetical protein [Holophagales bacterium]
MRNSAIIEVRNVRIAAQIAYFENASPTPHSYSAAGAPPPAGAGIAPNGFMP